MVDHLTARDLGVTTSPLRKAVPAEATVIRPHPSPAMERALQRIEKETPETIRRVMGGRK